ncbi:hypothetical protein E2C01_093962 [Portunus trituberculatus]|uniref:Uncharacterized protein n=1 Tax=Portunus trituberculatus TaxID=210409 RepID=A0A5B7K067_PORTR|nr:hypothetical protein [Portunus trituberculatus]
MTKFSRHPSVFPGAAQGTPQEHKAWVWVGADHFGVYTLASGLGNNVMNAPRQGKQYLKLVLVMLWTRDMLGRQVKEGWKYLGVDG